MSVENELFDRLRKAEMQISTHEAVCVQRYEAILATHSDIKREIGSINKLIRTIGYGIMGGMALILVHQLFYK
jgi:hypothetical protein